MTDAGANHVRNPSGRNATLCLEVIVLAIAVRLFITGALACIHASVPAQEGGVLQLVQTIVLQDVRGRIDHMHIDLDGARLFVAALGNNSVEVIDLGTGRRSARLDRLREPQGVAYVPDAKRLFVTSGGSGRVDVFAGDSLTAVGHVDALEDADNLRHDPVSGQVYVGFGSELAVLDVPTLRLVSRIRLAGHPESFQLESRGSRVFVNVPKAQQIAVVDRKLGNVIGTWDLGEMRANFPMALDEANHRLFVGTRQPAALLIYDTETGKQVSSVPIGGDADDLFFDGEQKRLYAICGEGTITIVQQRDADHYTAIGQSSTARGARTGLFVAAQRTLYVAVPARASAAAEVRVYKVK